MTELYTDCSTYQNGLCIIYITNILKITKAKLPHKLFSWLIEQCIYTYIVTIIYIYKIHIYLKNRNSASMPLYMY